MSFFSPSKVTRLYSWHRDTPDQRDYEYTYKAYPLPISFNRLVGMPPIFDQGNLGSCTGNAWAGAVQYLRTQIEHLDDWVPSRLFIYWYERFLEGTTSYDAGAQIRDGAKALNRYGVCHETLWPYRRWKYRRQPKAAAISDALDHMLTAYYRIDNTNVTALKTAIYNDGVVVFGFSVYDSFETDEVAATGIVPMPDHSESLLGGHACVIIGYDDPSQRFLCRNSWGLDWGQNGYFTIPYAYLTNLKLASDFWLPKIEA